MSNRLLNIRQTAEMLNCAERTIYNGLYRARKQDKPFWFPIIRRGRSIRFDIQDIERFIEDSKNE